MSIDCVRFFVPGRPAPKGSWAAFTGKHGRQVFKPSSPRLKSWEKAVAVIARAAMVGQPPWEPGVAVQVNATFTFRRPNCHYTGHKNPADRRLKERSPVLPISSGAVGDLDKLYRGLLDGLTGVVYADDGQVVLGTVGKVYGDIEGAGVFCREVRHP